MLAVRDVTVQFGGLTAIDAVTMDIPDRGVFALVGPNGAGKTTLLNVITRICSVAGGAIELHGTDLLRLRPHEVIRYGVTRSFQHTELLPSLTVLENVLVGLHARIPVGIEGALWLKRTRAHETEARERSEALLRQLDLWRFRDAWPPNLPYGIQKLVDVARALASEPKLLLLDEPFAGLSEGEAPRLAQCIAEVGRSCAILMIEHHLELVTDLAERVVVMNFGRKIAEGPPASVCADPEVITCYLGKRHGARTVGA